MSLMMVIAWGICFYLTFRFNFPKNKLVNIPVSFQVRYKLAPLIWKRLYKERARYTGGANAITLLLGRGSMLPWPSSMTLVMVIALGACVHTVMLSRYLISSTSTSTAVR